MTQISADDINTLISAMGDMDLPLDKSRFSGRFEFESLDRDVRKLQGMFAVLRNLPTTDPDRHAIYGEARLLQQDLQRQLLSSRRLPVISCRVQSS